MIYFLMAGGVSTEELNRILYATARAMAQNEQKKRKFNQGRYQGEVRTRWKSASIGTISGTEFVMEASTPYGDVTGTFIVRHFDLEEEELDYAGFNDHDKFMAFVEEQERTSRRLN